MTVLPATRMVALPQSVVWRERQKLINTREALSTALGGLLIAGSLALISGVWSIAVTVPAQLGQLQVDMQRNFHQSEERLRRLEQNEQIQDSRIRQLESQP